MISSIRSVMRLSAGIARGTARTGEYLVRRVAAGTFAMVLQGSQRSPRPEPSVADPLPARTAQPQRWPDPYDRREDPRDPADPDRMPFSSAPGRI